MSGKFKALGLALLAVFAMSAIAAQGAGAVVNHEFVAGTGGEKSVVLTGEQIKNHRFVAQGKVTECNVSEFSGTVDDPNDDGITDKATVHPVYFGECNVEGVGVSVHTEGCNYEFGSDTTATVVDQEHASVKIECEEGHEITITAFGCQIHIEPNKTYDGVTYEHGGGSGSTTDLIVKATVTGITYATTGSFCGLAGLTTGTHSDGTYVGDTTVTGYVDTGNAHGNTTDGFEFTHGNHVALSISTP